MTKRRQVLIVLGMHRSGTSAVAGALHQLGIPMGSALMPPVDGENEKGFWEDERIVALHEELLEILGMTWDDTRLMPEQWWLQQDVIRIKYKLRDIIKSEFNDVQLWAFKDPRTCRLMPLWHQILSELSIEPLFIHVVRNPVDVARSLALRNDFMDDKSLMLWFIYNIEAFQATQTYQRVIVIYNVFLENTIVAIESLCHVLGLHGLIIDANLKAIDDFVSPDLRHQNIGDNDLPKVPTLFSRLYVLSCGQYGEINADFDSEVDALVADFEEMAEIFSVWQQLPSCIDLEINKYQETLSSQKDVIAGLNEKFDAIKHQNNEFFEQINAWQLRAEEDEKQLSSWQARAAESEQQLQSWQARAAEIEQQLESWQARAAETEQQLGSWQAQTKEREKQLETVRTQNEEFRAQLGVWQGRAEESEQQLESWQARTEELEKQLETVRAQNKEFRVQLEAWQTRAAESEQQIESWQARTEGLEQQLESWKAHAEEREKQLEVIGVQNEEIRTRFESSKAHAEEREKQLEIIQSQYEESCAQLEAWQSRAVESEEQHEAWQARAVESEQQLEAWQARATEGEMQLEAVRKRDVISRVKNLIYKVVSYYRRNGLVALYKRARREVSLHGFRNLYSADRKNVTKIQPRNEINPEKINYHIDLPASGGVASTIDILTIDGWACSLSGIKSIDVFVDQLFLIELMPTLPRDDIYEIFPDIKDSKNSGFNGIIDISEYGEGGHELCIAIHDGGGNVAIRVSKVEKLKNEFSYHNYFLETLLDDFQEECFLKRLQEAKRKIKLKVFVIANVASQCVETVESILGQDDFNWTCDIVSVSSIKQDVEELLHNKPFMVQKVNVADSLVFPDVSDDTYLCFIQSGEMLSNNALLQWVCYLCEHDVDVCYSDSDIVRADGLHVEPNYKPDWSPEYLLSKDYIGGVYLVRNSAQLNGVIKEIPGYDSSAWRYDLLLNLVERTDNIGHIEKVLWSKSSADLQSESLIEEELKCVENALTRRNDNASVSRFRDTAIRKIHRNLNSQPKVSIIIPTTGKIDLLMPCVESILKLTEYENYEMVFLDNGRGKHPGGIEYLRNKGIRVIERNEPFNWAKLNNDGARKCDGEILLFLNDDIEITQVTWLTELVSHAIRDNVGTVGALLLYPDGRIQHGGVFLVDHGGGARHYLHFLNPEKPVYQDLQHVVREVSASTGACLMMKRSIFEMMNGFDEELAIVGNDIDICLRIQKAGYRNLWTPECSLIHHESVSRKEAPITKDERKMWSRWGGVFLKGDPYYNSNLTNVKTDCSLRDFPPDNVKGKCRTRPEADKSAPGINLIAYIRAEMGIGEAGRSMALAMDRAGIPFCIINYERANPSRMGDHSWDHKIVSEPVYDINLFHINADYLPEVIHDLPKKFTKNKYNIGLWAWEMPEFPDRWAKSFSYLDEIWVPSEFVRRAVSEKSPIPVVTIPHSVRLMNQPYLKRMFFNLPEERFLFLSMYDMHSIQERKNPKGAIDAYRLAFPNESSNTALVVKVNNANDTELSDIQNYIGNRKDIIIINNVLTRYEVDSLISSCDCFVSLHRSEGFGLAIAESMALGKPVVATYWSSNVDFMNQGNSACVDYAISELHVNYGPYSAGQHWAEPDINNAAMWMKQLVKDPALYKTLSVKAQADIRSGLSPQAIGKKIANRISELKQFSY